MSAHGVLSLRCPACARPFLSLPQQQGALVTCPHCAQSAVLAAYGAAQPAMPAATALPMRRRAVRLPDPAPAWAPPPATAHPVMQQTHPMMQPARHTMPQVHPGHPQPGYGAAPSWPAAPETRPMFTPESAVRYPPAPEVTAAWPAAYPDAASAAQIAPPAVPPGMFALQENPGIHDRSALEMMPAQAPIDFASMRETPKLNEEDMEPWQPPRQSSSAPIALLFLLIVVGACIWVLRDDLFPPMVVEIPAGNPAPAGTSAITPAPATTPATSPTPTKPLSEPAPEIRRAEVVRLPLNLVAAGEAGQKLLLDLIEATTPEARAALISEPEEHGADVEEFFSQGKLELLSFKPTNTTPLALPGSDTVALFQITTRQNPHGAILRVLLEKDGQHRLHWPLFAETHQRRLAPFLEKKPTEPAWFHLSFRRSHALDLPTTTRADHHAFKLQASADGSLGCDAVAPKQSPIGRYLDRESEWSSIYVARLLLQHRKLADGTAAIVILDCEGAAKPDAE